MNPGARFRPELAANQWEKHPHIPARNLLDRVVLGGSDGAIEGLAMTTALNGAGLGFGTIAVAGLAFALAGALSMFFSNYLSRKSELESLRIDMTREKMEIETEPEEEKREMEDLLKKDGYHEQEVKVIMQRLSKNKDLWLKEMLRRELQLNIEDIESDQYTRPIAAGIAFFLLSLMAVSPYAFSIPRVDALSASVTLSLGALFVLGSRVFIPRNFRLKAGLESALVGAAAGGLLFVIGLLVSRL
ncbi:MAG: VIT1/CCC1 transporter family protein [Thaumarchaeota archaeon]|nr:VIT1/CCC1 transporter family protein [Nitrososphaerota archaeon]